MRKDPSDLPDYIINYNLSEQYNYLQGQTGPASYTETASVYPQIREYTTIIRLLQKHRGHTKTVAQELKMPLSIFPDRFRQF